MEQETMDVEELILPEYNNGSKAFLYKHKGFITSTIFLDKLRDIPTFEVRENDIWVVAFPKSGITWVQEIVYLLMNNADTEKALQSTIALRFPYFEYPWPGFDAITKSPSPRLIKSHLAFSLLPNQMAEKKPKIIYVARNPKDIVVSYYEFLVKFLSTIPFTGSFQDFCWRFAEGKVLYGPWWKHVCEAWARKDDDNVLFLFYEDIQGDFEKNVRLLAEFLGKSLTEEQMEIIKKHCSFESMKNNNKVNYLWLTEKGVANRDVKFMRSGKVGDWKKHLSEDIVKRLDEIVATKLPSNIPLKDILAKL